MNILITNIGLCISWYVSDCLSKT